MNKCDLCSKSFPSKSKLLAHKNRKTPCNIVKSSYDCKLCSISFDHKSRLETHINSKKHQNNLTNNVTNNFNNFNNTPSAEDELKKRLQQEYEDKLNKELELKEAEYKQNITKLQQENEDLKFNFDDAIQFDNTEVDKVLVPISNEIITHKTLNKINLNDVLTNYSKLLTITDLLYIINYDINKLYVDKFWNNIEEENWIYLDEELINWFGYKEISKGKEKIVKFLKNEFEIEDDYKILNEDEYKLCSPAAGEQNNKDELNETEEKRGGSNKTYILMKSDCFKDICMSVGTDKSKEIKKYFIEVEKIFKFYLKYTLEYKNYELEKSKLIKNRYINKSLIKYNSFLYLITMLSQSKENIFKFGSTIDEKARKSSYNTGHVEADKFFYVAVYECYDAAYLEKYIARLLINFKIPNESEMYQLHFTALDAIIKMAIKNVNNSIKDINKFVSEEYDKYLNLEPVKF
jgi:phage anti-repressor protein